MDRGIMDRKVIGGLINSISRLIHLVACQTVKSSGLNGFNNIVYILKLLKPVLDEALESDIPSDGQLIGSFEELDFAVNEAREFMEKRPQRMSKIYAILQSDPMVFKIKNSSMEICYGLNKLLQSSSVTSRSASIEHCVQELQCAGQDLTSELLEVALKDLREKGIPSLEDIIKIMETLGLTSTRELLEESITLEKKRTKAELEKNSEEVDHTDEMIAFVTHVRCCMAKLEQFGFINGLPIPSYFRCPLSLELMMDPVIVASGQTYERAFIQKWLDSGLRKCPKTRQTLDHTNLIPNYTVKELIVNWCENNKIRLCDSIQFDSASNPLLSSVSLQDISCSNGFHGSTHRDVLPRSSVKCMNQSEERRSEVSSWCGGEELCNVSQPQLISDKPQSCCHSHSESISSAISSTEISSKFDEKVCLLGEVTHPSSSPSSKDPKVSQWLSLNQHRISQNGHNSNSKSHSLILGPGLDDLTTTSHVQKLIKDLTSQSPELQTTAASELRLFAKHSMENRILIAKCGAIAPLVSLLTSKVKIIQENAVTALLNLSINENNKISIAEAGAIEPLIHVLESGSIEAQENSAATLFSLSVLEEYKVRIGRSGAIKALVNLLGSGSLRGKKDAASALFNLSIFHENKARIVQAGAVKYLIELMDPSTGMVDKSVALLANLSTIPEGRLAITQEGGIPFLVEIVEIGSQRGKENAASALFQLCINSDKFCSLVLQEGAVPPLIALSQFGTPRAKEKAQQILGHFRSQREGTVRKPKS